MVKNIPDAIVVLRKTKFSGLRLSRPYTFSSVIHIIVSSFLLLFFCSSSSSSIQFIWWLSDFDCVCVCLSVCIVFGMRLFTHSLCVPAFLQSENVFRVFE